MMASVSRITAATGRRAGTLCPRESCRPSSRTSAKPGPRDAFAQRHGARMIACLVQKHVLLDVLEVVDVALGLVNARPHLVLAVGDNRRLAN